MDYTNRNAQRRHAAGDSIMPMLANAIRAGRPRVRQIAQIAGMMGDTELRELAGDADFPITNDDRITWLVDGGYLSGWRVREWVCDCLNRNVSLAGPRAAEGLQFAKGFALGKYSWQELFGMVQTIESIDVPEMNSYELRDPSNLRRSSKTYMVYAIASALSNGSRYMKRALTLSRIASCATLPRERRRTAMITRLHQEEYDAQLKALLPHLRAEAAQWCQ